MRWWLILLVITLSGCVTKLDKTGHTETNVDIKYLAKGEVDRIADTARSEVISGLMMIADKLYRRNPKEWRKVGLNSREEALARLKNRYYKVLPELGGLREGQASAMAFNENYGGDRVGALMLGLLTMVDAAFEYKEEFYILDSLNEQKLFNTARNMEVAVWKLGHDLDSSGNLFLLSNELDPTNRNISFEREFGRVMGILDFMAKIVADRNGRLLSRFTHGVVSTVFFPVSFLK